MDDLIEALVKAASENWVENTGLMEICEPEESDWRKIVGQILAAIEAKGYALVAKEKE